MRWEKDTGQYASGEILYLGKWKVGGYHWDAFCSMGDDKRWIATCTLPGIRGKLGSFSLVTEATETVQEAVKHWLAGSTSTDKESP